KSSAKYEEAAEQFSKYIELVPDDPMGDIYYESCFLAQQWLDEDEEYTVRNFEHLNTNEPDFAPVFYKEGIVFSSSREGSERKFINLKEDINIIRLDLYYQNLNVKDGEFEPSENLSALNSHLHEGVATFNAERTKVYFTKTVLGKKDRRTNKIYNSIQVFYSEKNSQGTWSKPVSAFDFNSTKYSVGQPSLSKDGKTIYFISDKSGGYGGTDIYYSKLKEDNTWAYPVNMGHSVNTFGHELFPYIHSDDTLYFSSDTHPGMGKLDIFQAVKKDNHWSVVTNLKPPINSIGDDFGIVFNDSQTIGFFSSDRFNGKGSDDIYSVSRNVPLQLILEGGILQIPNHTLYDGITYTLLESGKEDPTKPFLVNGRYGFLLEENMYYFLESRKEGFPYNRTLINLSRNSNEDYLKLTIETRNQQVMISGHLIEEHIEIRMDSSSLVQTRRRKPDKLGNPRDSVITEKPVEGIQITLNEDNSNLEETRSGANGAFNFSTLLNPGINYSILAQKTTDLSYTFTAELHDTTGSIEFFDSFTAEVHIPKESVESMELEPEIIEISEIAIDHPSVKSKPEIIRGIVKDAVSFSPMDGT
ncbi:MAG: PD40 domain-containing protein, partial [Candidatus Heimdallarchaeota archaeon]|nr:PD40 domain-containing protein [Candidatus Heimdallarchaeota archaeon]